MIDHTGVTVSDFQRSREFYRRALAPLGYGLLMEMPASATGSADVAGFGEPPKPDFWVISGQPNHSPVHIAFRAATRAMVDAFYQAAIAAGGRDARAYARTITRIITAPSCLTRTATTSKPFATRPDGLGSMQVM